MTGSSPRATAAGAEPLESPRFPPVESEAGAPFWAATRERRLVLPWCTTCARPVWFPREVCPSCLDGALEWREAAGGAVVYAVTVEHRPQNPKMAAMAPYAVALVDLDEGVRLLTNVIGVDPTSVAVGDRVVVDWEPLPDGRHLPQFRPA